MRRFLTAALALSPALSACDVVKVERTPRQFYTQREPARVDPQNDASELRARLRNFADELAHGNRGRALTALNPSEDVLVIGALEGDGVARMGVGGLAAALDSAGISTPAVARTPDLRVQVVSRETAGWFSAPIQFISLGSAAPAQWLRVSGVYAQQQGEWKLVEVHFSRPWAAPADSTAADTTRRDSARGGASPRPARPPSRQRE
ncbi:MAG TPA: nuclear transport factor 2 family protein [Longimicrobiaceae bacterium]|nr:nuclear transport factor 2 family protein [Longimicrobiaceae bacterium]